MFCPLSLFPCKLLASGGTVADVTEERFRRRTLQHLNFTNVSASLEECYLVMRHCFSMSSSRTFSSVAGQFVAPVNLTLRRGSILSSVNYVFFHFSQCTS